MRILRRGSSDLIVFYLVGSHLDNVLREALPGASLVAFDDAKGVSPREVVAALGLERVSSLVVLGYSQGVQAVRAALRTGQLPVAERLGVVVIDGTHASIPPEPWQIEIWREQAWAARRGERLFVATATNNVYTAKLDKPFMPTLHVLRAAVEPALMPLSPPYEVHENDLHVYAYASSEIDKQAHAAQQTKVLPEMLVKHVRPWLERGLPDQVDHPLPSQSDQAKTPLDVALGHVGKREDGPNRGAIVRASLVGCERDGKPLGIKEGVAWCAGFVGLCDHEAGAPFTWRASVRELVEDARRDGRFFEADDHYPKPGDLAIFMRDGKDPRRGEEGHVERVVKREGMTVETIGGNVGDAVVRHTWKIGPDLVGWIARWILTPAERKRVNGEVDLLLDQAARASTGA